VVKPISKKIPHRNQLGTCAAIIKKMNYN
jgi:hypothetical protein